MNVEGMRVLVVGGSGVLGSLIAAELDTRGASVALSGRDAGRLQAAAARLQRLAPTLALDLSRSGAPRQLVDWAAGALGGLDGVVNAAGAVAFGPLAETDPTTVEELVAIDLTVPLLVMAEAIPHIQGGFIVNLTGVVAEQPFPGMPVYVAAKTGFSAATRALSRELRRQGILVVDARPPHTETGLAGRSLSGTSPRFPEGLDPLVVARRIVDGIEAGEQEIPAAAFA